MGFFQAVCLGLIALILTPGLLFYFDVTPKLAVLLAGAAVLLPFVRRSAFSTLAGLYALSLIVSSALSTHPELSWFGSGWRRYGTIAQIAVLVFAATVRNRTAVVRAITVATGIAALYGVAQFAGFDPLLPAASYHVGEGVWTIVRPPSTFGYVSYFATWLVTAVFLCVAAGRGAPLWVAGLAVVALLLTGSRASMLALVVGGVVYLWGVGFPVPRRVIWGALALVIGAAVFYVSPPGQPLRSRTRWFREDPLGGARLLLWRDSLSMAMHRPMLGFGPEVFTREFPRFESEALARAYPDFAHESPHNMFLDAFVSQGAFGLILLAVMVVQGLRTRDPAIRAAVTAAVVSQQFTVLTLPAGLLTLVTLALASPEKATVTVVRPRWVLAPASIALLYCAIRFTVADAALARAQSQLHGGNLRATDSAYRVYSQWRFPGASADIWYSRTLLDVAARTHSADALARSGSAALMATNTAEDPFNAWYQAAQLAAARGDAGGAEQALRASIQARPRWFKPHWALARVLALQGRRDEAQAEATLALRLDAGKHEEVSRTLGQALPAP